MPKKLTFPNMSSRFTTTNALNSSTTQPLTPSSHIPSTFTDGLPLPKLLVFDLDYTLWPFWVDTHVSTPIKPSHRDPTQNTAMLDRYGESFSFYHDVPGILHAARARGITMGLASRTHTPDLAEKMLKGIIVPVPQASQPEQRQGQDIETVEKSKEKPLRAWEYFTHREIFPGSKIKHFNRIHDATTQKSGGVGVPFKDMVFFDDEGRNREVETQLGVTFVLVRDGVTMDEVDRGVGEWRRRRGVTGGKKRKNGGDEDEERDILDEMEG